MIVNIRGTSGSGKSTLVHRFLQEFKGEPISLILDNWKKPKVVAYRCNTPNDVFVSYTGFVKVTPVIPTYVIGRYETQCGGCDAMSYKGSHTDIEELVRGAAEKGNVIFEGLTISSTITRWLNISKDFPGQMVWAFMDTPEEVCYERIIARSGREPKRDAKGRADYNRKHHGCIIQRAKLIEMGERVIDISSDDAGYAKLLEALEIPVAVS